MSRTLGRALTRATLITALALGLCGGATASAAPVAPASLTMTSDPGDFIGQGQTWSYATAGRDAFSTSYTGEAVQIAVDGANGDWWYVRFSAPNGQQLAPGTYAGATRYPFQAPSVPGLSVSGEGRGCNTLTGSFEVHEARYAADGTLARLRATFEQHCEGKVPALRGSVEFGPPSPPPAQVVVSVDPNATVDRRTGAVTVHGSATCNRPAQVTIAGTIVQQPKRGQPSTAVFSRLAACSPVSAAWTATVDATLGAAFSAGDATVSVHATGEGVSDAASALVALHR